MTTRASISCRQACCGLNISAKFARTVSLCIFSSIVCAVRHCDGVGLEMSGKDEEYVCLDQALYFAPSAFVSSSAGGGERASAFGVGLELNFVSESLFSGLIRVFPPRRLAVPVFWGFATLFLVTLAAAERVDLVIMIVVMCPMTTHQGKTIYTTPGPSKAEAESCEDLWNPSKWFD